MLLMDLDDFHVGKKNKGWKPLLFFPFRRFKMIVILSLSSSLYLKKKKKKKKKNVNTRRYCFTLLHTCNRKRKRLPDGTKPSHNA